MALVTPDVASAMNASSALAFRTHFAKKQKYIHATGAANTKRVNLHGLNLHGILYYARKSNAKNAKTPNELVVQIQGYNLEDFKAWNLPEKYYRWNESLNCIEIAKKRFIAKGEQLDKSKGDAAYYPAELVFVPLPPGSMITFLDFKWDVNRDREGSVVKILDIHPKMKNLETLTKYPDDADFTWTNGAINAKLHMIKPSIFSQMVLASTLGTSFFHLENPNNKEGSNDQRFVMLQLFDFFDTSVDVEFRKPTFAIAKLIYDGGDDTWAYESKDAEKMDPKTPFVTSVAAAGSTAAPKKRNTKCMKVFAAIEQKSDPKSPKIETISAKVNMWETAVEETFMIRDIGLWYHVMRFVACHVAPSVLICTVNKNRTENSGWNANAPEGEDAGEFITLDGGDDGGQDESQIGEAAPVSGGGDTTAAPVQGTGAPNEEGSSSAMVTTDATEINAGFAEMLKAGVEKQQKLVVEQTKHEKVDFFLDLTVARPIHDLWYLYRQFLIPVTVKWISTPVLDPFTKKSGPKNFLCATSGTYKDASIDVKKPSELPDVICVSEQRIAVIEQLNELVSKKKGEYRVAVNTPTYVNESASAGFIQNIRTLTPEEGAQLLDGVPVKNITWTRPEQAQYALFYLNYASRLPAKMDESKLESLKFIGLHIHPGKSETLTREENEELPDAPIPTNGAGGLLTHIAAPGGSVTNADPSATNSDQATTGSHKSTDSPSMQEKKTTKPPAKKESINAKLANDEESEEKKRKKRHHEKSSRHERGSDKY